MVNLGSRNILLLYALTDVICGILVGLRDSCLGVKRVLFKIARVYFYKDTYHGLRDSSASVSGKKSRSRIDKSKILSLKNNDAYKEVTRCAIFNGLLFCFAFGAFEAARLIKIAIFGRHDELSWVYWATNIGVHSVILIPIYTISKFANVFWLQELSNKVYILYYGSPSTLSFSQIGRLIADVIFSLIIECLLIVQAIILGAMLSPWFALISNVIHYSLLNALYSFEYLWSNKGWGLHKRISYLEANWPYFIGFGMPLSVITLSTLLATFNRGLAFSVCYPLFIVAAINAPPITIEQRVPSLKVFFFVIWFTSKVSKGVAIVWNGWRELKRSR